MCCTAVSQSSTSLYPYAPFSSFFPSFFLLFLPTSIFFSALHSHHFISFSLRRHQKKQRWILLHDSPPQPGRDCNYLLIHILSQCWTTLASLLGKPHQVLQPKSHGNESSVNKLIANQHTIFPWYKGSTFLSF